MAQRPNSASRTHGSERLHAVKANLTVALAALLASTLLLPLVPAQQAQANEPLVFALIEIAKDANPNAAVRALLPGENVEFTIEVSCSSTQTDCVNMKLQDTMPAPLELISVSSATTFYDQTSFNPPGNPNSFELTFNQPVDAGVGSRGLRSGQLVSITVTARVPLNVDASFDGDILTNTAFITVDNPDSNVQDDAQVLLSAPLVLRSTITKTVTPSTIAAFAGTPVNFDLSATNSSNSVVDTLTIQDPADPASSNAFTYLRVTGITNVVFPSGANQVRVDWSDGVIWTNGTPAATATLPIGVPSASIKGLRLIFSNSNPAVDIANGATGSFRIQTETTAIVSTLVTDFAGNNEASSQVQFGGALNAPVVDDGTFVIRRTAISPTATKVFTPDSIVGGEDITVRVGGANGGDFSLSRMTITEPKTGTTSLAAQGISFDRWITGASGIEWPQGATAAAITYLYETGGWGTAQNAPVTDDLPAPDTDKGKVLGFTVSFTGVMLQGAYASLPYIANTEPVSAADANLPTINTIEVEVETSVGDTALADALDELVRRSSRINVVTRKVISPNSIYGIPGASALVSLPTDIAGLLPAVPDSTIGSKILTVSDNDPRFWDRFNAISIIATDVPATSTMTVRYWDASLPVPAWRDFPTPVVHVGPSSPTVVIPAALRDTVAGLQFEFVPTDPANTLPPGFSVQPNIRVAMRDVLRGTATPVVPPGAVDPIVVNNTVDARVENPAATPPFVEASDVEPITVIPVDGGGGGGLDMIDKDWDDLQVSARSGDLARLGISWGTGGLQYDSVVVSDTATDPAILGWDVAATVFEAFDLYRIPAITPVMDPLLQYDAIESVELYIDGVGWTPTLTNPCAGTACFGTFPGYILHPTERLNAVGVRFIIVENPNRTAPTSADPTAPAIGSGVAPSVNLDRNIDLVFQIRDVRRSNPLVAVLGNTRGAIYNMTDAGRVNNTARVAGRDAAENIIQDDTAADDILILDRPISVTAAKNWFVPSSGAPIDSVGVPQASTDPSFFPEARMVLTGTNISVVRVNELSLAEPTNGETPFDYFDVSDIVNITVPSGATGSLVTLTRDGAAATTHTIAGAEALSSANLANVIGIQVVHTGRIITGGSTAIVLDTKLRRLVRGTLDLVGPISPAEPRIVNNTVTATVTDPSGLNPPATGADNIVTAIASDPISIEQPIFGVAATKSIRADTSSTEDGTQFGAPAIQYDESNTTAAITLTGQPTGNVRATQMTLEDSSASFWNAYNFSAFGSSFGPSDAGPVSPIQRVQVDALVDNLPGNDLEYLVDPVTNAIETRCNGSLVLDACWVTGSRNATLQLPAGVPVGDIRGLRFTYTKIDFSSWERPFNPIQSVVFTVDRRATLLAASSPAVTPVPSTLWNRGAPSNPTDDRAPGEAIRGIYTNEVDVTAVGGPVGIPAQQWSATDDDVKQILFQHLPARVSIIKTPVGLQFLGTNIPYKIAVTNTGGALDRNLGNLVVTDVVPVDGGGAQLVIPNDPDTGLPFLPAQAFSYELRNASNVLQPAPTVTVIPGAPTVINGQTYTFTMTSPALLPKGWTLTINATMQLRAQFPTGIPVRNTATVTADQRFDTCESFSDVGLRKPVENNVLACVSDTHVQAIASAPLTIVKSVRGVGAGPLDTTDPNNFVPLIDPANGLPFDDLGILKTIPSSSVNCSAPNVAIIGVANEYYRFPCVPITRPGGIEEWAATFTNGGNIDITRIAAIDVLPRANDRGVIVNEARSSKWAPLLTTMPVLVDPDPSNPSDAVLSVEYITSAAQIASRCNATDIQVQLGMNATTTPPVSNASCLSGPAVDALPQRNWRTLTQAIIDSDGASIVALRFVIESIAGLVPGQKISITYRSQTAAAPEIAESASGIDRDSIAYNSIASAALGDDNGIPRPNRFVIEPRKVGVAMATGGVQLAKVVDGANAGAAYLEADYLVTLTCTSNGVPFVLRTSAGVLRNPFTLTRGAAATLIQGLPLYAKCDVSEANYGSVQSITPAMVIAQAARTTTSEVHDPHPAFGLGGPRPPIERSTVTNTYDFAGFTVTKTINNGGAVDAVGDPIQYNNFTFTAVCTFFDGVTTNTVLNTSFTLTATPSVPSPTTSYTNLPAGSVCTITETNNRAAASTTVTSTGGANTTLRNSSVSPTVDAQVVTTLTANSGLANDVIVNSMGFTNNFTVGQLTINKVINGLGATLYGGGTFTINVSCTRNLSGSSVNVYTNSFTFDRDDVLTRTISNLPTGASCAVTEPAGAGRAGATSTTVTPAGNATIGNATTVARTVTNTFDLASLVVTKDVVTNATDAAGALVLLDAPFTVRVVCSFQGSDWLATGYTASPMVLILDDDPTTAIPRSVPLTGLPANASCRIEEDQPLHTTSTDIFVDRGSPIVRTPFISTRTATFTLNADVAGVGRNEAVVSNNYGVATFLVSKEILGAGIDQFVAGAPYGDAEFDVQITCTAPGGAVGSAYNGVVTLTRAVPTRAITTIALNSTCSAVETNALTSGANATVYRNGSGVVINVGDTVTVGDPAVPSVITIENWYLTGSIDVTKTVGGLAGTTFGSGPFEVTLACTLDATQDSITNPLPVVILDPVRVILNGQTETFTRLPAGAECVLSESDTGAATSSFIVRDPSNTRVVPPAGYDFTIDRINNSILASTDQAQNGFDIQNDFEFAELTITKDVISAARINNENTAPVRYGAFAVTVDCTFNGRDVYADGYGIGNPMENLTLNDGDVWTLTELPVGAECTIEETDSKDAAGVSIVTVGGPPSGAVAVLTLEASNPVTVANSYDVGSLELSKVLTGAGVSAWGNEKFILDVVCTLTDATSPTSPRETWNDTYEFQRVGGVVLPASVVLQNIAAGSACVVTESGTGAANATQIAVGAALPVVGTAVNVTVTNAAAPQQVVVTNFFDLAEIDVNKVITGPGRDLYGQGPFEVSITCARDVNGTTVTIPDVDIPDGPTRWLTADTLPVAYFANYTGLPQGAECEIVETQIGGADGPGTVIEAGVGVEGPFVLGATPSDVTVTNFFGDPTLVVRKLFAGSDLARALYGEGPFQVRLDCTRVVNGVTIRVPIPYAASTTNSADDPFRTLDAANSYEARYEFLPTFALCVMTETEPGGALASVVSPDPADYVLLPDGVFQLGADATIGTVNVTNTFEFADFSLTKRVIGTDAGSNQNKEFTVELSCELQIDVNGTMRPIAIRDGEERTFRNGETVTWTDLPAGAECTVTETDTGGANAVILSYRGFPVAGNTVTLVQGDSSAVLSNAFLLAFTGAEFGSWILVGGQLLLVGLVLMFVGKRRRGTAESVAG